MSGRHTLAVLLAEFVGTFVLASAMLAMLVRTNFEFFSAIAAGVVYGGFYLAFGAVSGSNLNPAVTISRWTLRKISSIQSLAYIAVQVLAGYAALKAGEYFLGQALSKTATGGLNWKVLTAEGIGGVVFGMAVGLVAFKNDLEISKKAAILGTGLFGGILVASLAGNGILNPAVAIAVNSISWAYIVGPLVGILLGANIYNLIFSETILKSNSTSTKATVSKAVVPTVKKPVVKAKSTAKPKPKR